ncbi:hypothetical protein Tco_0057481, partial [Tanacetum coccineum]
AVAPGVLDLDIFGFQTLQHAMRMTRTWDSAMSLIPKGGDTIWGTLDGAPEADHACDAKKVKKKKNQPADDNILWERYYKAFTVDSVLELLQSVAPRTMKRGGAQYSYRIADNLDDKKYKHYKYWSNPLETRFDITFTSMLFRVK